MFAPQPERVVAECARVLKPGGLLAMANWTPGGLAGRVLQVTARHAGAPMGIAPPVHWGHPMVVRDRLSPSFENIELDLIAMQVDYPSSPAQMVTFFRTYFGPTQMAFNGLSEAGQAALAADLEGLWAEGNQAPDPASRTLTAHEYLQVRSRRKGQTPVAERHAVSLT
jgi:SAM-dependent methyltransferase